jgi:SAM-dependent methyltransferase
VNEFPALEPAVNAALRASIERWGVLVPIVLDADGELVDGHHRRDIAVELGVACPATQVSQRGEEASEVARTLNLDRRHLTVEQRREMVGQLRTQGHSLRAIGGALGVSAPTVMKDLEATVNPLTVPVSITGLDGRTRPSHRPPVADPVRLVAHPPESVVEAAADGRYAPEIPRTLAKPDLGGGVSHPARFSDTLMPVFAELLAGCHTVLDPFAGTGRIHMLQDAGFETVGVELEPEWADLHPDTRVGNALALEFPDGTFDAVCTSPTYGNRYADHHNAADPESRRSYTHDLGRPLSEGNSGVLQWGEAYRDFHEAAWLEATRVVRPAGRFVLNIKDHIRGGIRMRVSQWHVNCLLGLGWRQLDVVPVVTRSHRVGANSEARADAELVIAFERRGVR